MTRVAVATVLFGLPHSLLASTWTKEATVHLFGRSAADAWYRPAYDALAVALLALLFVYVRRQSVRDLYHALGGLGWALRTGQAVALGLLLWTAASVGLRHLPGYEHLLASFIGGDLPPMPDGQEPPPAGPDAMGTDGPLGHSWHPLNWLLLFLFWLQPRMTTRLLAFNLVVTAYVVEGSVAAESHTLHAYGEAYRDYQERIPFLVGSGG